jgi:heme exporter protein A
VSVAIRARGVGRAFGAIWALRGVDLTVAWGERVALLGPNGAGKTTLLRLLATLLRPTAGDLRVADLPLPGAADRVRGLIGYLGHQPGLLPDLTAWENLWLAGQLAGVPDLADRCAVWLARVGLWERRADRVRTFSRGMQQRLALARAFLADPPLLLLDEPDAGLDAQGLDLLEDLLAGGRTVLLTTHHLERGLALARRAVVLVRGQVVADAPAAALDPAAVRAWCAA